MMIRHGNSAKNLDTIDFGDAYEFMASRKENSEDTQKVVEEVLGPKMINVFMQ